MAILQYMEKEQDYVHGLSIDCPSDISISFLLSEDIFIVFSCRLLQFIVLPKGSEKEELLFPHFIDVGTEA